MQLMLERYTAQDGAMRHSTAQHGQRTALRSTTQHDTHWLLTDLTLQKAATVNTCLSSS